MTNHSVLFQTVFIPHHQVKAVPKTIPVPKTKPPPLSKIFEVPADLDDPPDKSSKNDQVPDENATPKNDGIDVQTGEHWANGINFWLIPIELAPPIMIFTNLRPLFFLQKGIQPQT